MFARSRISTKSLVQLSHRLATATHAGLDDRRIWASEAQRGDRRQREVVRQVSDALARGESIGDALAATGDYFPPLFRQIVALGDATGQLDVAYRRLAQHYEHLATARRALLAALAWPALQLGIAAAAVGLVIWISATLGLKNAAGQPLDMFGLGLTGRTGLAIYLLALTTILVAAGGLLHAVRRGALNTEALHRFVLKLPGVGDAARTLALARFAWAMQLVLDTAMDLRKALPLALEATGNSVYASLGPQVASSIGRGLTVHQSLAATGAFSGELLDAVEVGEQSGMLAETMHRQSKLYDERAAAAMNMLGQVFGYAVWAIVAALIITLIFRVFASYLSAISSVAP